MAEDEPKNDGELLEQLRDAAVDTAAEQLRLIHALKRKVADGARTVGGGHGGWCGAGPLGGVGDAGPAMGSAARAGGGAGGAGSAGAGDAPATGASEFLFDLARLSLGSYRGWLRVTASHFDFLVDALSKLGKPPEKPSAQPRVELKKEAKVGERPIVPFLLENPEDVEAEVLFTPLVFRNDDGRELEGSAAIVRASAEGKALAPTARIVLARRECARLCVSVDLGRAEAGAYRAESMVVLGGRVVGQLALELDVVAP